MKRCACLFALANLFLAIYFGMVCIPARAQANVQGQWTTLPTVMPINPIHVVLLNTGKVLVVSGSGNDPSVTNYRAGIWDPITGSTTTWPISWDMFCNGMAMLPDGRALIAGGTLQYDPFHGQMRASIFDPFTNSLSDTQSMAHGRWYPTLTTLSGGRIMAFSGLDETGGTNQTVEIYKAGSGWTTPVTAPWTPPLYPRMHLLPNGKVFYSGPTASSHIFDPVSGNWSLNVASTNYGGYRSYGTSVLLPLTPQNKYSAHVLIMGGGSPATATTETIDFSASPLSWQWGPSMSQARTEMNAVILPTGKVLAVGGSLNDEDAKSASYNADLYDPVTNTFSSAGANAFPRLYHSVALLLADATVWLTGGNPQRGSFQQQVEIYQPAYLFTTDSSGKVVLAARPTISSAPSSIAYSSYFQVGTPDAGNIASVSLVRAGAVTHAFDMDQRMLGLSLTADTSTNTLTVNGPKNGSLAPPGYYLLFIINNSGVPSQAAFVKVFAQPLFSISASPVSQTIARGSSVIFTVTVTAVGGFTGTVNLNVSGATPHVTASLNPTSVTGSGTSTLTVSADNYAARGIPHKLTVTGTSGNTFHTSSVTVTVQ